jgi:ABC-type sugar transport system substrate-binding protein
VKEKAPELKIVAQQTGEFQREKGQSVTEQLIQANPEIDAIYAHNDEMALGALVALRTAGKAPGEDVKVVSVDGTRNAVQAITKGQVNAVIESNPRFGPLAFKTLGVLGGQRDPREHDHLRSGVRRGECRAVHRQRLLSASRPSTSAACPSASRASSPSTT